MPDYKIIHNDCLDAMKEMEDNSIDFVVCDPPYMINFMGKAFDKFKDNPASNPDVWREALRICKPGSMLAAFGGSRTHHHLMLAIEGAGWEIRDCIFWIQGQGFPKSHNFGNKLGGKWQGYGTALKPSYEPVIICEKPYEIISLFVIILMDITNEIYKCQKFNSNVKDVELDLSDSLLLLDKVQQSIVQDHAKTSAWEKLSDVNFVIKNFISLKQELKERINQAKDLFARTNVKDNGKEISSDQETLHGKAEDLFANIQDIVTCVSKGHINQNIVLSWKNILIEIFQEVNKFTIEMAINLITGLRILKYYLLQSISKDTGNLSHNYEPIIIAMKPLDETFAHNAEKWGVGGINIDKCRIPPLTGQRLSDNIYRKGLSEWEQEKYLCNSCVSHVESITKQNVLETLVNFVTKNVDLITIENVKKYLVDMSKLDIGCLDILFPGEQKKLQNIDAFLSMLNCGKGLTEKNLKDMLSIILTMIHSITESKICSLCQSENISVIINQNIQTMMKEKQNMQKGQENGVQGSRWPSNLILDEESAEQLDQMTGILKSPGSGIRRHNAKNSWKNSCNEIIPNYYLPPDSGGASRFFYCAKTSSSERNKGLEGMPFVRSGTERMNNSDGRKEESGESERLTLTKNSHPTVKPISLMKYIITLLAPPGNPVCLDMFMGSGSTGVACKELGIDFIGIEKEKEYVEIATKRLDAAQYSNQMEMF